jgi:hypothetical protein
MDIQLAEQRIFAVQETLSADQCRARAMDRRISAVASGLTSLLQRPKPEEIVLTNSQKRFEPFWHVACASRTVYDRARQYSVPSSSSEVSAVTLHEQTYPVADLGRGTRGFTISVVEHCREEWRQELFADGQHGNPVGDAAQLLQGTKAEISDLALLAVDGTLVVAPETRASFVVRQLLHQMLKPLQADTVHEEILVLEATDLYYRPIWAFEFHWQPKDKRGVIEIDAVTGQVRTSGSLVSGIDLAKMLKPDALFDLGADTIGMVIPGGNLAVKLAKVVFDATKPDPAV